MVFCYLLFQNQTEIGQQVRQENNGFAHPTVTNSPIQLQNRFLPVPLYEIN